MYITINSEDIRDYKVSEYWVFYLTDTGARLSSSRPHVARCNAIRLVTLCIVCTRNTPAAPKIYFGS